jgi:hypothetical protein
MQRLRQFINLKVLAGGAAAGICLFAGLLAYLSGARNEQPVVAASTAALYVIAAPSATPLVPLASATFTPEPTTPNSGIIPGGELVVGAYVQITGTGGDGLRLRADPGLEGTVRFLAIDGEVFQVMDGPRQADGYSWWLLQAPYDPNVAGWAVDNFFVVVQNP